MPVAATGSDLAELDPPYLQDDDLGNKDQLELAAWVWNQVTGSPFGTFD